MARGKHQPPATPRAGRRRTVTQPCQDCGQDWSWEVISSPRLPALLCDACLDARAARQVAAREGEAPIIRRHVRPEDR
jgi:hypothetical protein